MDIQHLSSVLEIQEELFCQTFFRTAPASLEELLLHKSQSRSCFRRSQSPAKQTLVICKPMGDPIKHDCRRLFWVQKELLTITDLYTRVAPPERTRSRRGGQILDGLQIYYSGSVYEWRVLSSEKKKNSTCGVQIAP